MNQNKIIRNLVIIVLVINCITFGIYLYSILMDYPVPVTSWLSVIITTIIAYYLFNKHNKEIDKDE